MNLSLLAQESVAPSLDSVGALANRFLQPEIMVFMIPIVAIIVGGVISAIGMMNKHRERIAMIQAGFDPDAYKREEAAE